MHKGRVQPIDSNRRTAGHRRAADLRQAGPIAPSQSLGWGEGPRPERWRLSDQGTDETPDGIQALRRFR